VRLYADGCKKYIFIRPYHKQSTLFLNEFGEFLLVNTLVILKLTDKFVMLYASYILAVTLLRPCRPVPACQHHNIIIIHHFYVTFTSKYAILNKK
jgi:hypothetical protein